MMLFVQGFVENEDQKELKDPLGLKNLKGPPN